MKLTKTDAAYRVSDPDLRDPSSIEKYYGDQKIDTRSYYHAKKDALFHSNRRVWKDLSGEFNLKIWYYLTSPGMINAFYWPNINSVADD